MSESDSELTACNEELEISSSEKPTPVKSRPSSSKRSKPSSKKLVMNVSSTKYEVVRYVAKKLNGWKLSHAEEGEDFDVWWTDGAVQPEKLASMKAYQKINHFPGMYALARKNNLAKNLMRMKRQFSKEYNYFPKTWLLPTEMGDFKAQFSKKNKKTFIVKPEASCQGRGIFLTKSINSIDPDERYVAQEYLSKPYLIDDLKFDLRIYVLVAGCSPLRIFIHEDGLARFATEKYVPPKGKNLEDMCMHLTNYAINKNNSKFVFNEDPEADDVGHKRSLAAVFEYLRSEGHDVDNLWKQIGDMTIKTLVSVQPSLAHCYKSCQPDEPTNSMCFEILGLDVILDHKLRPYLLEVNHSPSFTTDSPLDKKIKRRVINEALKLMNISEKNKRKYFAKKKQEVIQRSISGKAAKENKQLKQEAFLIEQKKRDKWEEKHMGGYTKIYPSENSSFYDKFLQAAEDIWQEWTGGKIVRAKKEPEPRPPSCSGLRAIKPVQSLVRKSARTESKTDSTLVSSESGVINKSPPVAFTPSVFSRLSQPVKRRIKTEYNPLPPANIYLDQEYCNMYTLPRSSVDDTITHAISSQRFKTSTDRTRKAQVEIM